MTALEFYIEELRAALAADDAPKIRRMANSVLIAYDAEQEEADEQRQSADDAAGEGPA